MAGTVKGGLKAAATNYNNYGTDFYRCIGKKGGMVSRGGGFMNSERARIAGAKGGSRSRRGVAVRWRLDAAKELILLSFKGGCAIKDLAKQYNVSTSTMSKWLAVNA